MDLDDLQQEIAVWQDRNFATTGATELLLGVAEEVGELSHAHLKGVQGIRHSRNQIREMKKDAVGDILIYLMNYCSKEDLLFSDCLHSTWATIVKKRDWISDPEHGNADGA